MHAQPDQMRDHFGVGFRAELDALLDEFALKLEEVLDNPVVDHDDFAGGIGMRMGVALIGLAVRGPAGVSDAQVPPDRIGLDFAD